jgi:Predicted amidohydrolase
VLFPELVLTGYPPEDFLLVPEFLDRVDAALKLIVPATKGTAALVGLPRRERGRLYNSAACIIDGKLCGFADKQLLPTYDVFDEKRYFTAGIEPFLFDLKEKKLLSQFAKIFGNVPV